MAYASPVATSLFADLLTAQDGDFNIERFDEFSSMGTGHDIVANLANPRWSCHFEMRDTYVNIARRLSAVARWLGSNQTFQIYDLVRPYPILDPDGLIMTAAAVIPLVNTVSAGRDLISFKIMPASYSLSPGDKFTITVASTGRVYYGEISELRGSNALGVTSYASIFPRVPIGTAVDDVVNFLKPLCKMRMKPNGWNAGTSRGDKTRGISLDAIEAL